MSDTTTLQYHNVNLETVDTSVLVDINQVHIDTAKNKKERLKDYLDQIHNPYCFKCGSAVVKISFTDSGGTLQDRLLEYFEQSTLF